MGNKRGKYMTNQDMLRIAMKQSAEDIGCKAEDFLLAENVIVPFRQGKNAKKFLTEPITCHLISYGSNIVAAVTDEIAEIVTEYIGRYVFYHCFETPNMQWLNDRLMEKGYRICFMSEYYLPDLARIPDLSCGYEMRLLDHSDFEQLYLPEWSNALCRDRE